MNPIILPPAMQTDFFSLGEKENSEFKPVKRRLKIDLVSYPAQAEGLVNMIKYSYRIQKIWTRLYGLKFKKTKQ